MADVGAPLVGARGRRQATPLQSPAHVESDWNKSRFAAGATPLPACVSTGPATSRRAALSNERSLRAQPSDDDHRTAIGGDDMKLN
jgi:hypothetical protein